MKKNYDWRWNAKFPLLKKLFRMMKLTTFLILISISCVFAGNTYSQTKGLNINLKNSTLKEVFSNIEEQSDFCFMYSEKLVNVNREVSINLKNKKINEVLDKLFVGTNVNYQIRDRFILLKKTENNYLAQQKKKISGKVTDSSGSPIPGVTILLKGSTQGSITDLDGNYNIINISSNDILQFSFVGMKTQEVAVGENSTINVTMVEEAIGIEEVVAIGYGKQKKRDVSSAISSVNSEVFKDRPISNFAQGISGNVAGVSISQTNGAPGGGSNIVIRGVGSINASNSPLYVLDGQPLSAGFNSQESPINFINPNDIESIEILKDAASSAIYGTRAANGVILITTKSGKKGKGKISVSINHGVQNVLRDFDQLNREDFIQYFDDARANAYIVEDPNLGSDDPNADLWSYSDNNATRISNWENYSSFAAAMNTAGSKFDRWITVSDTLKSMPYDTDWQGALFGTGHVTNAEISFSGGTDDVTYYISGNIYKNEGMVKNTGYNRFGFRSNIEKKVNNWFKIGLNLAPTLEKTNVLYNSTSTNSNINPLIVAFQEAPIYPIYNDDGSLFYTGKEVDNPWDWNIGFMVNPLSSLESSDIRKKARLNANVYTEINIMKDLLWKTSFNYDYQSREVDQYLPSYVPTTSQTTQRNVGTYQNSIYKYWDLQSFMTYSHNFDKHHLTVMLGMSVEETKNNSVYLSKKDFPQDIVTTLNQGATVENQLTDARTNMSSESMIGSFARASYNYAGKYYLTASVRRDGSSKFGSENQWAVFPSFSTAWRISDENFFSPLSSIVSDMKLRAGWGKIGNSGISNYLALATLGASSYVFGSGSTTTAAYYENKIPNDYLGWETTKDLSIGTDVSFLAGRISLSVDYFHRITDDMLFDLPLPDITGFSNVKMNLGSMKNQGFEYLLNTRNFVGKFSWNTTATVSYYRNCVTNIGSDKRPLINNSGYTTEGRPLADLWGTYSLGAFKDWEDVKTNPIFNADKPSWRYRSMPGSPKIADVNGDGILDSSDKTVLGNANPDFIWGLSNTLTYKNFDLSFKFTGRQGGKKLMTGYTGVMFRGAGLVNTTYEYFNNYWTEDNTDAKYPAPNRKKYDSSDTSGGLLYDASYILLENVALGYTIPGNITQKFSISNARVYINIDNVWLHSDYPGYNPMGNYKGDSALSQGVDSAGDYPLPRTFSIGVKVDL